MLINFQVKNDNFLVPLCSFIGNQDKELPLFFYDLIYAICSDISLLYVDPMSLVLGIAVLCRKNKLKAKTINYSRRTNAILDFIVREAYETPIEDFIRTYISMK